MKRIGFFVPLLFLLLSLPSALQAGRATPTVECFMLSEIPSEVVHRILLQVADQLSMSYSDLETMYGTSELTITATEVPHQYHVKLQTADGGADIVIWDGL